MNIIIVGGKGNGTVVLATIIDMIQNHNAIYNFIGFVNNNFYNIKEIEGHPVIGDFSDLEKICLEKDAFFVNAITSVKTIKDIDKKYRSVFHEYESRLASIIHPDTFLGYHAKIGKGAFIGPQNYIGQNVIIDELVFIHSHCYIARDAIIGAFSYLAPKVYIGAESIVGKKVYCGINSLIKERLTIDDYSIIGMGAIILDNTEKNSLYYGSKATKRN
ncbi:MAG TPA: hypothetical protein VLZ75_03525 [Chitinophagales bacterium]|nr:hypothetical protein [Chitinophagales bacterium]